METKHFYKVLKVTNRGALLITDDVHVVWVQGFTKREDGSFTKSAVDAMSKATKTVAEWEKENEKWSEDAAVRQAAWEREREEKKAYNEAIVSFTCNEEDFKEGSDKAWKVKTKEFQRLYGTLCHVWEWLPKSMVTINRTDGKVKVSMPRWLYNQKNYLKNTYEAA